MAEHARQRPRPPAPQPPPQPAPVVRLPIWPAELRTCPSCVLRSALFGVVQRGRRKALERAILATWEGVTIRYTGWRLDQADLDAADASEQEWYDVSSGGPDVPWNEEAGEYGVEETGEAGDERER